MTANQIRPWVQDRFYISTFEAVRDMNSDIRKILEATNEAGINLVEITFKDRAAVTKIVELCERLGIQTIVQDPSFGGIGEKIVATSDEIVQETLSHYAKFQNIFGYYVWDEPVRDAFLHCRDTKARFERYAPGKLPYFALFPSYGMYTWSSSDYNWESNTYVAYIDEFLDVVDPDVVCFDYYPYRGSTTEIVKNDLWRDMGYVSKRARELGKPFWFYFQAVELATGEIGRMNRQNIGIQMFAALAYGAKGLSWFTSMGIVTDVAGNKTERFDDVKALNEQVLNLGGFLLDKKLKQIYHTSLDELETKMYFLDNFNDSDLITAAPDNLIIGVFGEETSDRKFVLVVNKQEDTKCSGNLRLSHTKKVEVFQKNAAVWREHEGSDSISLDLAGGDCILFMFQ